MTETPIFIQDDFYVMGNLCMAAIAVGHGDRARQIMSLIQRERPNRAQGFVMEALFLHNAGKTADAIAVLETPAARAAEIGRDEALALYVVLLGASGQEERASALGQRMIGDGVLRSSTSRYMVLSVIEKAGDLPDPAGARVGAGAGVKAVPQPAQA
ncbi:MAG: hypothetical protein AAGC57_14715 [Pseudomonadota bacterium]